MRLAIIVPTLNEATTIGPTLAQLSVMRARGARVIVADGGSRDDTVAQAAALSDEIVNAPRGRSLQMNAGARAGKAQDADTLWFLHADTLVSPEADRAIAQALATSGRVWGRFDVRIEGASPWLAVVARLMNLRSRASGICTGDQAIFVTRGAFLALQGFAPIPLMEDIEFSGRARRLSPPIALRDRVVTSGRRWRRSGLWRTILLMWQLRLAYLFGADPEELALRYPDAR